VLELIQVLGGSLTITRENPLWDKYQQKLPESIANDIAQQTHLMFCLEDVSLTLSNMIVIVADHTLPFLTTPVNSSTESTQPFHPPVDSQAIHSMVFTQQIIAAAPHVRQWFPRRVNVTNPFDQIFEISNCGICVLADRLNLILNGCGGA